MGRLRKILADERGVVAVMVALGLPALVGLTGAAVDMGMVYSARGQLQNAADSAALAAASEMIGVDGDGKALAQPSAALAAAHYYTQAHKAVDVDLTMLDTDFVIGKWDNDLGEFSYTGFSSDPSDLTAAEVTVRRDNQANTPVSTFFARILGLSEVELEATSVAHRGHAGGVSEGDSEVPIVISPETVVEGGEPDCDRWITIRSQPGTHNGTGWTSYKKYWQTEYKLRKYVKGYWIAPEMEIGDTLYIFGWNLSYRVFRDLKNRWEAKGGGDWEITVPVVGNSDGSDDPIWYCHSDTPVKVIGFAKLIITEVKQYYEDGKNEVTARLICDEVHPGSQTGGQNFGLRAERPALVN